MRQPLVAGNWKLNGSKEKTKTLIDGILAGIGSVTKAEVAVCPPYLYLPQTAEILKGSAVAWGGQNCSQHDSGAYTGEIAAPMLKEFGCKYVILGHSDIQSRG